MDLDAERRIRVFAGVGPPPRTPRGLRGVGPLGQADLPAVQPGAQETARLPGTPGDPKWASCPEPAPGEGAPPARRLNEESVRMRVYYSEEDLWVFLVCVCLVF